MKLFSDDAINNNEAINIISSIEDILISRNNLLKIQIMAKLMEVIEFLDSTGECMVKRVPETGLLKLNGVLSLL